MGVYPEFTRMDDMDILRHGTLNLMIERALVDFQKAEASGVSLATLQQHLCPTKFRKNVHMIDSSNVVKGNDPSRQRSMNAAANICRHGCPSRVLRARFPHDVRVVSARYPGRASRQAGK
jgi:hypothetical protein